MKNPVTILRKRSIAVVQLAALTALASCGVEAPQPPPVITKVTPTMGAVGTTFTIYGRNFDDLTDVGFELPPDSDQFRNAYESRVPTSGGTELALTLDEVLGACPMMQLADDGDEVCPMIGIILPAGDTKVFVVTHGGESNRLPIHLNAPAN